MYKRGEEISFSFFLLSKHIFKTITLNNMTISISIDAYILYRLKQVGIDTVFGIPDDFNMLLLNLIEDDAELIWENNANELNAAYTADGYARVRGIGAVVTAFGVGELSAINGIASYYSEVGTCYSCHRYFSYCFPKIWCLNASYS